MTQQTVQIPMLLGGRAIWPSDERENYELTYDSGLRIQAPKPTDADIEVVRRSNEFILHDLHFQEIIGFLLKVGRFWDPSNSGHPLYAKAVELLSHIHGYAPKMAQREMNLIGNMLMLHPAWHDLLEYELGNRYYLEEWIPRGDALVHAQPMGNVAHVLVGNVPVSGVMSMVRGIVTKNQTIAKIPKRDPITSLYFALSCLEVDPDHPVSRSLNVLYWPAGDSQGNQLLDLGDVICVWGGGAAVSEIKARARMGVDVLEFGPRSSFAVVGKESNANRKVALDLAHDMSIYNQEACFSPQIVFIEGDHEEFVGYLKDGLDIFSRLMPKGHVTIDVHAHISRSRLEALYAGNDVAQSAETNWTIVTIDSPADINEHPLSRAIYVVPINDIRDCLQYISRDTQTVSISPWKRSFEIREQATLLGADKLVEIGMVQSTRVGSPHDSVYPMQRLVRWVGVERGADHWGKFIPEGPVDTTKWIMMNEGQLQEVTQFETESSSVETSAESKSGQA